MSKRYFVLMILLGGTLMGWAQAPSPAPELRQFDFWVGTWKVNDPTGKEAGTSKITQVADGRAIREEWSGGDGISGTSLNYYDPKKGKWFQDWVGGGGQILHLSGELEGKSMVLSGERETPVGAVVDRISWTPLPDGGVHQEWSISADQGKTWKIIFSGFYISP